MCAGLRAHHPSLARPPPPQSVMLQIAATELEKDKSRRESEKQNYLSEHCPPLHLPGSMSEVQVPSPSHAPARCLMSPLVKKVVRAGGGQADRCPPPTSCPHPQELCKQLHAKIDAAEEEKYDMEVRVQKSTKEVSGRGAGPGVRRGALRAGGGPGHGWPPPSARPPPHSWRT